VVSWYRSPPAQTTASVSYFNAPLVSQPAVTYYAPVQPTVSYYPAPVVTTYSAPVAPVLASGGSAGGAAPNNP